VCIKKLLPLHPCIPGSPTATSQDPRHAVPPQRGAPIIDRHDRIFPRERHRITLAWDFLGLLVPDEGPQGNEILYHATVLELVLDGVRMVRAGLLKKSLEVVCQRPRLVLATARGGNDALHVRVVCFLVVIIIVIVGRGHNPLRAPLSPLLATLGILDSGIGWCRFAAAEDRFPAIKGKEWFGCLLASGVLGSDAEQLLGGVPENIIWCPEGRRLSRVTHTTLNAFGPSPLGPRPCPSWCGLSS
jgi:hypothetical protein